MPRHKTPQGRAVLSPSLCASLPIPNTAQPVWQPRQPHFSPHHIHGFCDESQHTFAFRCPNGDLFGVSAAPRTAKLRPPPCRAPGPASARSGAPRALPSDGCAGHRQGIGADLKDQQTPSADEVCRQSRGWRCSSTNSCDRRSKRSTRPVKGVRVSKRSVVFLLNQST